MLEQRKILERIIERHEDYSFRIKGWFAAVIGGLAAALHVYHLHLTAWWELLAFLLCVTLGFIIWLTYHRVVVNRAINLIQEIESRSSDNAEDLDQREKLLEISKLLSKPITRQNWLAAFKHPVIWLPTLVGIILLGVICWSAPEQPEIPPVPLPTSESPALPGGSTTTTATILFSVFFIAVLAGCLLLLLGRGFAAKTTGMIAVLAGLLTGAQFVLVKEAKVESIFSLKNLSLIVNWGSAQPSAVKKPPEDSTRFGAQYLGSVEKFRISGASIIHDDFDTDADFTAAQDALRNTCSKWQQLVDPTNALVLIIGHTDRLPLGGPTRTRYEANNGLALARASAVREQLAGKCWGQPPDAPNPEKVVLLAAGPLSTPSILPPKTQISDDCRHPEKSRGFQCDRRVDVYTLATVPVREVMPAGEASADRESSSIRHAATQLGFP
jgi:hypothetical protein